VAYDNNAAIIEDLLDHSQFSPSSTITLQNNSSPATSRNVSQIPDSSPNTAYSPDLIPESPVASSEEPAPSIDNSTGLAPDTSLEDLSQPIHNGPEVQASARPFCCEVSGCDSTFESKKDLNRHQKRKDHPGTAHTMPHQCACGQIGPRRDNYIRHLLRCPQHTGSYRCDRGHVHESKEEHLRHLRNMNECGKRRGRRPNERRSASAAVDV
jgi:hypothetical protein